MQENARMGPGPLERIIPSSVKEINLTICVTGEAIVGIFNHAMVGVRGLGDIIVFGTLSGQAVDSRGVFEGREIDYLLEPGEVKFLVRTDLDILL